MRPEPRLVAAAVLLALLPTQPAVAAVLALVAALLLVALPTRAPVRAERP